MRIGAGKALFEIRTTMRSEWEGKRQNARGQQSDDRSRSSITGIGRAFQTFDSSATGLVAVRSNQKRVNDRRELATPVAGAFVAMQRVARRATGDGMEPGVLHEAYWRSDGIGNLW